MCKILQHPMQYFFFLNPQKSPVFQAVKLVDLDREIDRVVCLPEFPPSPSKTIHRQPKLTPEVK